MNQNDDTAQHGDSLRKLAEERLLQKTSHLARSDENVEKSGQRVHELQVHQIELEMQNEELCCAQQKLDVSYTRYFDLYDMAPVGYFTINSQGLISEANLTAADLLGVERSVLAGQPLSDFIVSNDQDRYYLCCKTLLETGLAQALELRMVGKERIPFWADLQVVRVKTGACEPISRITITNIDDRKRTEEALRIEEIKFRSIFENSNDAIVLLDMTTARYVDCNRILQTISGYTHDELCNMKTGGLLSPQHQNVISGNMENLRAGRAVRNETNIITKDGRLIPVEYNSILIELSNKSYVISVIRDITEHKKTEQSLQDLNRSLVRYAEKLALANQDLEAFSYSVSHDLRNPLNAITTNIEVLSMELGKAMSRDTRVALDYIMQGVQRMAQVISDLMMLSGISKRTIQFDRIDLSDLVSSVLNELSVGSPERDVRITLQPELTVDGDAGLIRILIENLVRNAWKFSSRQPNTHIEFGAMERAGESCYFIRDNGIGFDMKEQDRLFKPYQRLHSASDYKGSGIGLAIAKRIVEKHNGTIWAESEKDKGATFFFRLNSH